MVSSLCTSGGTMDPHQAWLVLRGVKTPALKLKAHPKISWVNGPGLEDHPQYALAKA